MNLLSRPPICWPYATDPKSVSLPPYVRNPPSNSVVAWRLLASARLATDALYVIVCRRETADALNYSLSARRYTLIVRQSLEKGKKHAHPMNMKSATLHERLLSQRTTEDRLGIMRKPFP
ncbi:hypothetical protein BHE74_00000389 [Ensete ventricosum]|nr:hypothetical protein GW17_00044849 [Ensete ventricosum]RWW90533.1 hypothetical protein BHE74_00000389 [Ensete ventricosum]